MTHDDTGIAERYDSARRMSAHARRGLVATLLLAVAGIAQAQELSALIARVAPAVVVISDEGAGSGSGFVVSREGRIVTSLHVIARMTQPRVTLASGATVAEFTVQGYDRERDIAILKVDARNLPALRLGHSGKVTVGQRVVAFGTPLGLSGTATAGIVSAVRAHPRLPGATLLQTDAAINPGNSGGPLVDAQGRAVGVVVSVIRSAQNLGFAVPANDLRALLRSAEGAYTLGELRRYLLATDWAGQVLARRWRAEGGALFELEGSGESLRLTFLRPPEEARLGARLTLSLLRKGAGYEGLSAGEVNCETLRESRRVPWLQEAAAIRALALERLEVSYRAPATPDPEGDCKLAFQSHSLTLVPAGELEAAPATGELEYIESMRKRRAEHALRRARFAEHCREVRAELARNCKVATQWNAQSCKTFGEAQANCVKEGL